MNWKRTLALFFASAAAALAAVPGETPAGRLAQTVDELCATPHRLAGTAEGRAAGDAILRRLREAGFDDSQIVELPFEMVQLKLDEGDCYLENTAGRSPLQPLRPNGMVLPVTPPEGLEGETVYLGNGRWEQFEGKAIEGRIAVFDYNCSERWTRAVQAGAVAVVFVGDADPTPRDLYDESGGKCFYAHLDIPRYFAPADVARRHGLLTGARIRLFCRMGFRRTEGRNILVFIPGTASGAATNEVVVLACRYDSFGPVPFATRLPGRAANVAGLLEAAAAIRLKPFERPVVVAFFDNECQQQMGQFQFHFARDAADPVASSYSLARMIEDRGKERAFLERRLKAISDPAALMERKRTTPDAEDARQEVLKATERLYNKRVTDLSEARRDVNLMARQVDRLTRLLAEARKAGGPNSSGTDAARIAKLSRELENAERTKEAKQAAAQVRLASAEAGKEAIFRVRKMMTAGRMPGPGEPGDGVRELYDSVIDGVRTRWTKRLAEQARECELLERKQAAGTRLVGKKVMAMVFWSIQPGPRRWAIQGPPEDVADIVANLHLTRWLNEQTGTNGISRWSGCAGFAVGVPSGEASGVSGRTTLVLELANPGVAGLAPPPPIEAPADMAGYAAHLEGAIDFCRTIASRPELARARIPPRLTSALVFNLPVWTDSERYDGCYVRHYDERLKAGEDAADAIVSYMNRWSLGGMPPAGEWGHMLAISSQAGTFPLLTVKLNAMAIQAALHDDQGRLVHLSLRQPSAPVGKAGNWELAGWYYVDSNNQILLSEIKSTIMLAGIRTPRGSVSDSAVKFMDAITEGPPKQMNLSVGGELLAAYTGRLRQFKVLQGSQLLLANTPADPAGSGYEVEPGFSDALARSARDTWTLNESRLDNLRRRNVLENALERLHARAERLLDMVGQGGQSPAMDWARRQASLGYSDRVYEPVRAVTNDMVKAVMILLLLAIPFAFAFERAVFGAANIYLQLLGFALVFGAVFTILFFVHPAFKFVTFPAVVLLAFVIIIMSSMVIVIMWGKFEYEVRKLHGVAIASHQSTRTARGLVGAAVSLGIATMRRRPLRSVLTALTILLLTFTILFFGSFKSEDGVRMIYVGPGPSARLVEVGSVPGSTFDPQTVDMLRQLYSESATGYVRGWTVTEEKKVLAGRLPDDTPFSASGLAALPPEDITLYPELRRALQGDIDGFAREGGIFLPPSVYARVAPQAGPAPRYIEFSGRRYVLRGSFDPGRLKMLRTLDGVSFVPPNVLEVTRQLEQEYPNDAVAVKLRLDEMELEDYPPVDPETIALVWEPQIPRLTMPIRSLVFMPKTDSQAREMAGEIAILLDRRVSVSIGGDHSRALYAKQVQLGGFAKVVVPLILGGLIIFGTMLSSVSDRQREIFTFSALGLGPRHVATLFFAEASVYAVVGGMGGYLFAHVFAKIVEWMARLGWVEAPMMNHSSMNAMLTLLVVMATVLASTLYPAFKASRAANPGAQRQWRMPEPEGDRLRLEFPFTVSNYDMVGLISFLEEHLLAHREKSVGLFASNEVEIRHEGDHFTLSAAVWLQPFDQGISQSFTLWTKPSRIPGIDQVHVEMRRLSGSPGIWQRSARVFIHDLRNQFILWRTIPDEAAEHYYRLTAVRFSLPQEGQAG